MLLAIHSQRSQRHSDGTLGDDSGLLPVSIEGVVGHVDGRDDVPTLGKSALPWLLEGGVGGTGIVLAGQGRSLVVLLLVDLVPLTHGVGVSVMLRVVVVMEEVVLVPHLVHVTIRVLRTSCIGNSLGVAQLGLLDCGGHERFILKFSFFCLLLLNSILCLRQGAERGVFICSV